MWQVAGVTPRASNTRTAVFDVDGTLAIHVGRGPYEWSKAATDAPNVGVVAVLQALNNDAVTIVYVSGRPEAARTITEDWIDRHIGVKGPLHLRPTNDNRRDAVVKREIYETHIRGSYNVIVVFDDRDQVVEMWRNELGLTCFQVGYGAF